MIARWQRAFILSTLLAMAAWLAWQWPRSPLCAVLGALLPLGIYLLVMAVQFLLMHLTNRTDPAPRARAGQVLAAWWAEVWVGLSVFAWRQPFRHRSLPDWLPAQPTGRRGVVLVHGFMCNRGLWLPWFSRLQAQGHDAGAQDMRGNVSRYMRAHFGPPLARVAPICKRLHHAVEHGATGTGSPPDGRKQ